MSQWRSDDDFETDMKAFSEIRVSTDEAPEEPPPPTITQYVARMRQNTKSIFDTDDIFKSADDQKVTLVYSGRGKGCMTKIFVPGRPVPQAIDDEEGIIVRKIKEETGCIGHNALVESKYRKLCEDAKEPQSMILKNGESPNSPTSPQPPLSMIMQHAKKKHKHEKFMPESDNAGPDFAPAKPMGGSFLEDQFKLNTSTLSPGRTGSTKCSDNQHR